MTQPPSNVGWTPFFVGAANGYISGNQLYLDSPVNTFAGFGAPASLWPAISSDPAGWRVEANCTILSRAINNAGDSCLQLIAGDGTYRHFLDIFPDHIALIQFPYSGVTTFPVAAEGTFHTYVMTGVGPNLTVTVDGAPAINATMIGTSPGFNTFQFGDLLFNNETHSAWNYVAFGSVPAPAATALLPIAGLLAARRRRR
ncbi:MAG TPA: hypothetical protein VMM80_11315 [Bacteroidota bacterium]|nr:hypothetical protein [Bacteroidota bacterium]